MELAAEAKRQGRQYDSRSVYQLLPADAPRGNDAVWWGVGWQPAIKRWMAPFIMQARIYARPPRPPGSTTSKHQ